MHDFSAKPLANGEFLCNENGHCSLPQNGEAKGDRQNSDQKRRKSDKKVTKKVAETEKKVTYPLLPPPPFAAHIE